jgi:integral membrane sensor domain MASE1
MNSNQHKKYFTKNILLVNIGVALLYWLLSHINFLIFKQVGLLPMPIWPAAALAIIVAFYSGWKIAPGLAIGTILANSISLGGSFVFACCIAIMNTLGPIIGASIARKRVSIKINISNIMDVVIFLLATVILVPMLTAFGGIGFKWFLGLLPTEMLFISWLKWSLAHSLATFFFAIPVFAWIRISRKND